MLFDSHLFSCRHCRSSASRCRQYAVISSWVSWSGYSRPWAAAGSRWRRKARGSGFRCGRSASASAQDDVRTVRVWRGLSVVCQLGFLYRHIQVSSFFRRFLTMVEKSATLNCAKSSTSEEAPASSQYCLVAGSKVWICCSDNCRVMHSRPAAPPQLCTQIPAAPTK